MAENPGDHVTAPRKATVESVEEEIARTRKRVAVTPTHLNGDVRALLNPETPVMIAPAGTADRVAAALRTAGQTSPFARLRKAAPLGVLTAVAGLTVFLFRSGIARQMWNRNKR